MKGTKLSLPQRFKQTMKASASKSGILLTCFTLFSCTSQTSYALGKSFVM